MANVRANKKFGTQLIVLHWVLAPVLLLTCAVHSAHCFNEMGNPALAEHTDSQSGERQNMLRQLTINAASVVE